VLSLDIPDIGETLRKMLVWLPGICILCAAAAIFMFGFRGGFGGKELGWVTDATLYPAIGFLVLAILALTVGERLNRSK